MSISTKHMTALELHESICPGSIVGGRYQILNFLGRGEYGEVYACRHLDLPNLVLTVRLMESSELACKQRSARLWNDLQSGYLLDHPGIARYFSHHLDGGELVAVREYLDGGTLSDLMAQRVLRVSEVIAILAYVASALSAVHEAGFVHCDISASNVLISEDITAAKLKGFGWALFRRSPLSWPGSGNARCRISHTPEYRVSREATTAGDIYCFGLLANEMLCGNAEIGLPPRERRHACPARLSKLIETCLDPDPRARFGSARELLAELERIRRSLTLTIFPQAIRTV